METRQQRRLVCWESVFDKGVIEGLCPICQCSKIRYCTTSGNTFQKQHIISRRDGGSSESWNLLPGCGCNQNMGSQNLIDWMGTRGNKRDLLLPLFLRKYKSLVSPYHRQNHREVLIEWVRSLYRPLLLDQYADWLLLPDKESTIEEEKKSVYFEKKNYRYTNETRFYRKKAEYSYFLWSPEQWRLYFNPRRHE